MPVRAAFLAMALAIGAMPAVAQVTYKLVDRNGKVTYSDHVPKNFDGQVTRLDTDSPTNLVPGNSTAPAASPPPPSSVSPRKANREALEKALREAQDRYEAALKAKADGEGPKEDEMQMVQRRYPVPRAGEGAPRSNCREAVDAQGASFLLCATQVPGDPYYERQKALEAAVAKAQEELESAERAYRRGAD